MGMGVQLVEDNSLKVNDHGYQINVRLNWYRSLPLSCVQNIKLCVNGTQVPASDLRFAVNGQQYSLDEMKEKVEEFWFVQDAAQLQVNQNGAVTRGGSYKIEAEIALRFPYIAIGPGKFLVNNTKYTAEQIAA